MKNNSILKRCLYFGCAFLIFLVEQLPIFFISVSQLWQVLLLSAVLLIISGLTLYIAKRANLLEGFKALANGRAWLYILLGFLVLYLVKILGGITLVLEGLESTSNQAAIENAGMHPLVMVLLTVIVAPIVEETVFRGFIMGRVFDRQSILGLLISSFLFGLAHLPTSIGAWIIYGGMGLVLGWVYRKTEKLEYTMMIHFLNNGFAIALMYLLMMLMN